MKFTYYGHSCFSVVTAGRTILFDPFISGNEMAGGKVLMEDLKPDYILLSHGHVDHTLDCLAIARQSGALVVCSWEIYEWLQKKGYDHVHPMNTGGRRAFEGFSVKCVTAHHSSGLPDGSYGGNPMGFIIYTDSGNFYYSGDTALTLDMQLIPRWAKLNFAVLPIGDNFTMDAADAAACAEMIGCKTVIGVHYDTFGYIKIDHARAREAFAGNGAELILMDIGEEREMRY